MDVLNTMLNGEWLWTSRFPCVDWITTEKGKKQRKNKVQKRTEQQEAVSLVQTWVALHHETKLRLFWLIYCLASVERSKSNARAEKTNKGHPKKWCGARHADTRTPQSRMSVTAAALRSRFIEAGDIGKGVDKLAPQRLLDCPVKPNVLFCQKVDEIVEEPPDTSVSRALSFLLWGRQRLLLLPGCCRHHDWEGSAPLFRCKVVLEILAGDGKGDIATKRSTALASNEAWQRLHTASGSSLRLRNCQAARRAIAQGTYLPSFGKLKSRHFRCDMI